MQGGMLHARRMSQSPPCSAKAGGGGGDIGKYRSASFMEEEFKVSPMTLHCALAFAEHAGQVFTEISCYFQPVLPRLTIFYVRWTTWSWMSR